MLPAKPSHLTEPSSQKDTRSLLDYLEKHQRDLNRLRQKLNAYATCRRKGASAKEQVTALRQSIELLGFDNLTILSLLKDQKISRGDYLERVATQFSEFHKLRRNVNECVQGLKSPTRPKQKFVTDSVQILGAFQNGSSRLWGKFSTSMQAFFF